MGPPRAGHAGSGGNEPRRGLVGYDLRPGGADLRPDVGGGAGAATGAAYPMPEAFRTDAQAAPAGYPGTSGPAGGAGLAGGGRFGAVPAPPQESLRAPSRVDAVPGTPFGLVHLEVAPVTSGPAVASLVTGVGSVLVAFAGGCLGLAGSSPADWGGWVAGAFAVLAGLLGVTGVLLGELGRRQTSPGGRALWPGRRHPAPAAAPGATAPPVRFTGRGLAIAGISCAAVGLALTVIALAVAVLLQLV
ncbi:phage holin family protein [Plantactinospora veratri]